MGAVRGQDALRLLDDQPQDRVRVADRGDARGDLAQGALGLGAARGLLARPAELADQLRVVDGDGREVREGREERAVLLAEPARPRPRTPRACPSTTASPISGANAIDRMPTRSKNSRCGAPSGKRSSAAYSAVTTTRRSRIARWTPDPPTPSAFHSDRVASSDARVVRPVDLARGRVEEVDHRARRAEQPGGLVDDVLEQLGRVLDRHHPPRDLAQRALRVGGPLEGALRGGEAVDEAGVGERDRGLAGQRVEQPERVLPERVAVAVARPGTRRRGRPRRSTGAVMTECRSISCTPSSPSL